jgi:hypothetical protein
VARDEEKEREREREIGIADHKSFFARSYQTMIFRHRGLKFRESLQLRLILLLFLLNAASILGLIPDLVCSLQPFCRATLSELPNV